MGAPESTLEDKSPELKSLNEAVLEYILDDSQIQEDVGASCDFAGAIQECIVDLQTALTSKRRGITKGAFQKSAESGLNTVQAGSSTNVSIYNHAKLPKLELRPGSDADLFMSRTQFEFGPTQIDKSTPVDSDAVLFGRYSYSKSSENGQQFSGVVKKHGGCC